MKKIIFFGDSIFFGQGISIYKGWIPRLARHIEKKYDDLLFINLSKNGRTTKEALLEIDYSLNVDNIEYLFVQFGLNDCNHWDTDGGKPRVDPKQFYDNLNLIIEKSFSFKSKKVILSTNHLTFKKNISKFNIKYDQNSQIYNEIIRQVKADSGKEVSLIDIEQIQKDKIKKSNVITKKSFLQDDGIHLNIYGHNFYLSIFKKFFLSNMNIR